MPSLKYRGILFDWGNTLMVDKPEYAGPMKDWPEVEAVAGAFETLQQLSGISRCYLATNARDSSSQDIWQALKRVGLDRYLEDIFCYQSLGYSKPDRIFFEAIGKQLECPLSELLMVGDDYQNDIQGAMQAGLNAVWLRPKEVSIPSDPECKAIVHLDELISLISRT
ncbi:HAD family hydrolase [Endozoicomonadaceae bacterium StTr2]